MPETEQLVRAALDAAGIEAADAEIAKLTEMYPGVRSMAEAISQVPEADEEQPGLVFDVRI